MRVRKRRQVAIAWAAAAAFACGCGSTPAPATPSEPSPPAAAQGCGRTSVGLTPLIDLAAGSYGGEPGGLYPGQRNDPPAAHLSAGLDLARAIGPVAANGQPDAAGRYAFISIGMSNTTQEFSTFVSLAAGATDRHPRLTIVDGAQGGMTAADWANPGCSCWSTLAARLQQAGIAPAQVATAWIKLADARPTAVFPVHARTLQQETAAVLRLLKSRYPNLVLAYLSSRIYAGYATSDLNPEPYAYESGFAMRWVIEDQLAGGGMLDFGGPGASAPWIAWGPYLWADGVRPNGHGLSWACADLQSDGTHPSTSGRDKVAQRLLDFVRTDPTAREWWQ
jgi:hypothetical protein